MQRLSETSSDRYTGKVAAKYDSNRYRGRKWESEQKIVKGMLETLPEQSSILDVPFGTGRFLPYYKELNLRVTGADISQDMLEIGSQKAQDIDYPLTVHEADIRSLSHGSDAFDCVLCIRLFNLMPQAACRQGLKEISRVSRRDVILGIRYFVPVRDLLLSGRLGDLALLFFQIGRRVFGRKGQMIHTKPAVDKMFDSENLRVINSQRVERRRDGTDYYIFHLIGDKE